MILIAEGGLASLSFISLFVLVLLAATHGILWVTLHTTQSKHEPVLLPTIIPFLDPIIGIARHKINYLVRLKGIYRTQYNLPIFTMRMPFRRFYVVTDPHLVQEIQRKTNTHTFVPNLLEFGMLFSGLNSKSKHTLHKAFGINGNALTQCVHKYLTAGITLEAATRIAISKLSSSISTSVSVDKRVGLLEFVRHDLTLALTRAVYGPGNPFEEPGVEESWQQFVPGINHLLYSPAPWLTGRKALRARSRIMHALQKYFEEAEHENAFPMVSEMFEASKAAGISSTEAAKLELANSLAMLSSGAITAFWLLFHIVSDPSILRSVRVELQNLVVRKTDSVNTGNSCVKLVDLSVLEAKCPVLTAVWHESLRYHSAVTNIKSVTHDTHLAGSYLLKRGATIMIPGRAFHHSPAIWGPDAHVFSPERFLPSSPSFSRENLKRLKTTSAFRPFGAGASMCPGRHFSSNVVLGLVAMMVLGFEIECAEGRWREPESWGADMWNSMPKPDRDVLVLVRRREEETEWRFVWGDEGNKTEEY